MATHIEKLGFSERLLQSLEKSGISTASPTALTRKFNLLYPDAEVSVQAVRRWLEGTAIPSQDKLVVLAAWLKVSPEWLRFGDGRDIAANPARTVRENREDYDAGTLVALIELLSEEHRRAVQQVILALLDNEGKPVKSSVRRR